MRCENYRKFFEVPYMMGPNCLRLLDELLKEYPLQYTPDNLILDLGCGSGLTSLFLANETGATVYANDLWISEEENRKRFADWNMQDKLIPVHEDAVNLHFDKEMFDALISVDSYHYFAGKDGFFAAHILPFIKSDGIVLIAIPGMKNEYDGRSEELLAPWLGEDAHLFQGAGFWKRTIGTQGEDQKHYESIIKPFTTFIGIMVKKR